MVAVAACDEDSSTCPTLEHSPFSSSARDAGVHPRGCTEARACGGSSCGGARAELVASAGAGVLCVDTEGMKNEGATEAVALGALLAVTPGCCMGLKDTEAEVADLSALSFSALHTTEKRTNTAPARGVGDCSSPSAEPGRGLGLPLSATSL